MKICGKEFRIIEKTYSDGHKEYHAEALWLNLFFFKIWKDYVYDVWDYGYGSISFKDRFSSYEECVKELTGNVEKKYKEKQREKLTNKNIFL